MKVYVPTLKTGQTRNVIHTDRDCPRLNRVENVNEYPESRFPDKDTCKWCTGDIPRDTPPSSHYRTLESMSPSELEI